MRTGKQASNRPSLVLDCLIWEAKLMDKTRLRYQTALLSALFVDVNDLRYAGKESRGLRGRKGHLEDCYTAWPRMSIASRLGSVIH